MNNAHSGQTRRDEYDGKAISRDNGERNVWAIGDERITGAPSDNTRVSVRWQYGDPTAMDLPERDQGLGVKSNGLAVSPAVFLNSNAVVTAPQTQIERRIGGGTHPADTRTEGMDDALVRAHRAADE
jgi:hypothetical protein